MTLKDAVGANGGYSAAFTYDLARSIVYMRQGNPAWAGQERDGFTPIRPDDLFFGASSTDGRRTGWISTRSRFRRPTSSSASLVNLILYMNRIRKPLPASAVLPNGRKAAVVMTGDDHVNGGTAGRFDDFIAASPTGCSVADWECVRATSYVFPETALDNAAASAYNASGFEITPQVSTGCANWTPASLRTRYLDRFNVFSSTFPGLPRRAHIAWTVRRGATTPRSRRSSSRTASASIRAMSTGRRVGSADVPASSPGPGFRCALSTAAARSSMSIRRRRR